MILLESPLLISMDSPPITQGGILIEGNTIHDVGFARDLEKLYSKKIKQIICLNDTVLMPGFVNAHSHLELTALRGFSYPGNFTAWIEKMVEAKNKLPGSAYEKGMLEGIQEMLQSGITCIGDHVSFNTDLVTLLNSPFRGILFMEVLGIVPGVAEEILGFSEKFEKMFKQHASLLKVSATPHSVHALHPEYLEKIFDLKRAVYSIHLAESEDENIFYKKQNGKLYEFIQAKGETPSEDITQHNSPFEYLEEKGFLSNPMMAIHCNYAEKSDLELLAKHKMSVVHCPSSHAYFGHKAFDFDAFRAHKIMIALGTDSLASGESLSMLDQIRIARQECPAIPPNKWLRMATSHGAHALQMSEEIGSLTPGKKADIIGFELSSEILKHPESAMEEILRAKQADFVMIDGKAQIQG